MGFKFDSKKSEKIKKNPKRRIDFGEVQEIWRNPYYEDFVGDNPRQFRAIGWVKGKLFSVIFEIRVDEEGEFMYLVTLWKSTTNEVKLYEKNST